MEKLHWAGGRGGSDVLKRSRKKTEGGTKKHDIKRAVRTVYYDRPNREEEQTYPEQRGVKGGVRRKMEKGIRSVLEAGKDTNTETRNNGRKRDRGNQSKGRSGRFKEKGE